jgi:hypothetical protein
MTTRVIRLVSLAAAVAAAAALAAGSAGAATTAPTQASTSSCTLVSASVGATDVNAAGLVAVHLDPIAADVTLNGLVGTLVCGLL